MHIRYWKPLWKPLLFWKFLLYGLLLTACSTNEYQTNVSSPSISISREIAEQLESNQFGSVDFSKLAGPQWSKVCFLGPYNENSAQVLGFDWHIAKHTHVLQSDSHNVIIFATDTQVIDYVIQRRDQGDFWQWSGRCLPRKDAILMRDDRNGHWKTKK